MNLRASLNHVGFGVVAAARLAAARAKASTLSGHLGRKALPLFLLFAASAVTAEV